MERSVMSVTVEDIVARIRVMTPDEMERLVEALYDTRLASQDAAWYAALDATRDAARATSLDTEWYAALDAAWGAAREAARAASAGCASDAWLAKRPCWAALDAAVACVVYDLIGQHGYTQEHHDTLTAPWREVIGDPWKGAS